MRRIIATILSDYMVLAIKNFCNYYMSVKAPDHFKCLCQEYDSVSKVHQPPIGSSSEWSHRCSSPERQASCMATKTTTVKDGAIAYPLNTETTMNFSQYFLPLDQVEINQLAILQFCNHRS